MSSPVLMTPSVLNADLSRLREEVERKYFPERYKFWPFGDPFIEKRKQVCCQPNF